MLQFSFAYNYRNPKRHIINIPVFVRQYEGKLLHFYRFQRGPNIESTVATSIEINQY